MFHVKVVTLVVCFTITGCGGWSELSPDDGDFTVELPQAAEEQHSKTLFRVYSNPYEHPESQYGASPPRRKLADEWLPFRSWIIDAARFEESYLVGYNELPDAVLNNLSDEEILEELINSSHLVRGAEFGPDPIDLKHRLPALETVYTASSPTSPVRVTKRVFLSREHKKVFVLVYGVKYKLEVEDAAINLARFFNSFRVTD